MDSQDQASEAEGHGVPTFAIEAVMALLVLALGLVIVVASHKLGAGWTSDGPGAGYFPFYVGLILCISALGVLYQSLLGKNRSHGIFVTGEQLRRVLVVFVPAVIYVLAVQFVGIYIASAVYIALFMVRLGKISVIKSVVTAVLINAAFFLMFEVWFKVPLAKGTLDLLSFLGY
ncbi:tripartite tricarboxylate transporter TctB family protein [Ramlibacter sp. G-1-2-2]|uniref:Tripartite tricarboxylate transporter TctB family protein n=1 Tax=Ramlibacter agri TaxID=2728837 RepID=A0A848H710_9BURK|nr:tripartite tricarboxylate transporter TctB family protein [Ramlibacter agri]NML45291.1 tripartite tricarboxylate transporter TctB family protein [Ramlibacter agri]